MWTRKKDTGPAEPNGWSAEQIAQCEGLRSLHVDLVSLSVSTIVEASRSSELAGRITAEAEAVCGRLRVPARVVIVRDQERMLDLQPGAGSLSFSASSAAGGIGPWRPSVKLILFDPDDMLLRAIRSSFAASAAGGGRPGVSAELREPLRQPFAQAAPGEPVIEGRSSFTLGSVHVFERWGKQPEE